MKKTPLQVIIPTLRNWAQRPDAATDLREIFGTERLQTSALLDQIRNGDFSWLPGVEVLPSTAMEEAYGAYSRETGTIYLASDCPADLKESVLLEEIGHHIDALFNATETPGDEGALFSAAVRGISLTEDEITAILNEDDSAFLNLLGREIAVECASRRTPTPVGSRTPTPSVTTRVPVAPIVTVKPAAKGNITQSGDWVTSDVDYSLNNPTDATTKRVLSLVGGGNLTGTGNTQPNTLSAASNSGDTTLIAGSASTTLIGGSGNNWLNATGSSGTVSIRGGSGSSTMLAGSGPATLVGGGGNNSLVAGTGARTQGQSLVGGNSTSSLFGNTLRGGSGRDTLRSGAGFSTLLSGSNNGVPRTINAAAASGVTSIRVADATGLAVGQQITGNGIAAGTTITAIDGTQLTLSARTTATIDAGTQINTVGNILIGQGVSNSLRAGSGNDSLVAISGNSTLLGGTGRTTLLGGAAGTNNWLQSGYTLAAGTGGNTLIGGAGSNTLVAGATGSDSIVGGANQNLLLVTQANRNSIINDTIRLSTLASARNTLGVSLNAGTSLGDTIFSGMATQGVKNLSRVENVGSVAARIVLGENAETVGVRTLASGTNNDTLSVAGSVPLKGFEKASVLLDASRAASRVSMVGGSRNDTLLGSRQGFDTMNGGAGNDSLVMKSTALFGSNSFGNLNGGADVDTLYFEGGASLSGNSFNGVSGIEVLRLFTADTNATDLGTNAIGSLQGSGIRSIIGGRGSDTISGNVYGAVRAVTRAGSTTVTLTVPAGTAISSMGFAVGQVVTGNGIGFGTKITGVTSGSGIVTLTLDKPTTSPISQGGGITGWINGVTLDGSASSGLEPTSDERVRARTAFRDKASSITAANFGTTSEFNKDTLAISTLRDDPSTYINRKGDYLVAYGQNNLLIGGQGAGLTDLDVIGSAFTDQSSFPRNNNIRTWAGSNARFQRQVVSNTLVSGAFVSNTLIGGAGANLYFINNEPGAQTALPTIQNPSTLQSGSTIQFIGTAATLNDAALSSVGARAAQRIVTANGNNLIEIGQNGARIGIQSIIGGVGSDTFVTALLPDETSGILENPYPSSVYFDASRGSGRQSLASGSGNDTLLAGTGNATLDGGDGNNSLRGGLGRNLVLSGVGNSTLDGGFGDSTLQADGGVNRFIVRNYNTRILNPYTLARDPSTGNIVDGTVTEVTTPQIGIVDTYVNFDPIQGDPVSQFAPDTPDNSPSITKSPSFASRDLSSFYNLQYFNLLGTANYGVGNALDNTISAVADNALILGMGGNNTLVTSGANSSLYGNITGTYSNPDLYAAAPIDTKTQEFVDGVIGVAGNNSLVANGANSFLDGGEGYNDSLFGSGSNTLIGNGSNSTLVQRHQSDVLVSGTGGTVFTSVDLYRLPDNISNLVVVVTPQATNSGQITEEGQRMTAGYVAVNDATGGYTGTNGAKIGDAPDITVADSVKMQVLYGSSEGTTYGGEDGDNPLIISGDKNSGFTLSWDVDTTTTQTLGYLVKYRCLDADGEPISPWLTYLSGSSQDLNGTSANPSLFVDNLPTTSAGKPVDRYDFQVIAQETVLPAVTDMDTDSPTFGELIARPVSLIGGSGSEVIFGAVLGTAEASYSNTRAALNNTPPGFIASPDVPRPPYSPTARFSGLFPTYQDGKAGNDLLIAPVINNGTGDSFTSAQYIDGVKRTVDFKSGLNTLVGGVGSDTFVVSNGGTQLNVVDGVVQTSGFDQVIKYGLESSAGENNLVISAVDYLTLSDTDVSQGKFINQAWAAFSDQYVAGNRLDNTLVAYGSRDTLLGAGGRDSIVAANSGTFDDDPLVLIGGNAYGLDSIAGALADYANGQRASIYRDTDPVPVTPNGPGSADNSQYWMVNGPFGPVFDYLRNSDTLVANYPLTSSKATLDGGAGNDSMVGGIGNDTLYVSNGITTNAKDIRILDNVVGGGGNDWIVFTGSDTYWSGRTNSTNAELGYELNKDGDAAGGQSISNIKLQDGSPVARRATGNATSTGNQQKSNLGEELGSNQLIGNGQANTLNGGGVGGTDGKGVGVDTLTGGAGADRFEVDSRSYISSGKDLKATSKEFVNAIPDILGNPMVQTFATDASYAVINDFDASDTIKLNKYIDSLTRDQALSFFAIGAAPTEFKTGNIQGVEMVQINGINPVTGIPTDPATWNAPLANTPTSTSTKFGIYYLGEDETKPNLVATIETDGLFKLGSLGNTLKVGGVFNNITGTYTGGIEVDGTYNNLGGLIASNDGVLASNYLGYGKMFELRGSEFADRVTFV